jgi:hypothetical protein
VIVTLKDPTTYFEYEGKQRKITALVFESGSVVVTGSPTVIHAQKAFLTVFDMLKPYLSTSVWGPRQIAYTDDTSRKKLINYEARRQDTEKRKDVETSSSNNSKNMPQKTMLIVEEDEEIDIPSFVPQRKIKTMPSISVLKPQSSSFASNKSMTCEECMNSCNPSSSDQKMCCYCIRKKIHHFKLCFMCAKTARFYENPTSRII